MKVLFYVAVLSILALLGLAFPVERGSGTRRSLRFAKDGTFQISIFEDLHYGENAWESWGPQQDISSEVVINEILDVESQQLVVLNGDLVTGENTYLENSTDYLDKIVAPLVQRDLSWASTYGNHDSDFNLSRENILAHERLYHNARTTQMVFGREAGVSNYYLPVYPHKKSSKPALLLWLFDSRGGFYYRAKTAAGDRVGQPNWVDQSVVDWFVTTNQELTASHGGPLPSLAFVHIPTYASRVLQTEAGVRKHYQPGINDDYPLAPQGQRWCAGGVNDGSCEYGGQDVPFMQAIASTPGLMALFSGHDHGDTWCYKWDTQLTGMNVAGSGVNLCFGQHSGYGGYGTWARGSRQVLVREETIKDIENLEVETWIRLENQNVVGAVTLNSTYGQDRYPATKNTHSECPTCDY